jgi:hypothetical protein
VATDDGRSPGVLSARELVDQDMLDARLLQGNRQNQPCRDCTVDQNICVLATMVISVHLAQSFAAGACLLRSSEQHGQAPEGSRQALAAICQRLLTYKGGALTIVNDC